MKRLAVNLDDERHAKLKANADSKNLSVKAFIVRYIDKLPKLDK